MSQLDKAGSGSVRGEDHNAVVDALGRSAPPTLPSATFVEQAGPDTPPPGQDAFFFDSADGLPKYVDDQGDVHSVGGGGSQPGASTWTGPFKTNCFAGQQLADSVAGSVDGGTFTVTHDGDTTPSLAWDVSAANLKTALEALPSIGAGNVRAVTGSDVNGSYIIQFVGLTAVEMLTANSVSLTGPDAPYNVGGTGWGAEVPLVTLAVGDILEDTYWSVPEAFDAGALLEFVDQKQIDDAAGWNPNGGGNNECEPLDIAAGDSSASRFTNFSTPGGGALASIPTLSQQMVAQWVTDTDPTATAPWVPVVAKNEVEIYATTVDIPAAPATGVLWLWVKTSTPAAP